MAESGPLFTPDVIVSSVPLSRSTTLATRLGAWPELAFCLIAVGALAAAAVTTRRRRPEPPEDDAAPEPADEPASATR
jgi:apolipoprotein N-acyltransferase